MCPGVTDRAASCAAARLVALFGEGSEMKIGMCVAAAAVAAIGVVGSANAGSYLWNWNVGDPGSPNNNGGVIESIHSSFNTNTKHFTWNVLFSNQVTTGYTLAVNKGPNPKGHGGELALLYLDASSQANVKVTAYAYNGQNAFNSWKDGDGNTAGNQTPDKILSKSDNGWILNAQSQDIGSKRLISLTIDASLINGHAPDYGVSSDWTGICFGEKIGLWFHPMTGVSASYGQDGFLTAWSRTGEGWFDASNRGTTLIPLPSAALMGAAGLVLVGGRRRRTA